MAPTAPAALRSAALITPAAYSSRIPSGAADAVAGASVAESAPPRPATAGAAAAYFSRSRRDTDMTPEYDNRLINLSNATGHICIRFLRKHVAHSRPASRAS